MDLNDLIKQATDRRDELLRYREAVKDVRLEKAFIVECEGLSLAFDVDDKGHVTNSRTSRVESANRFSRRDAEHVAANVKNGRGTLGNATHIRDAVQKDIDEMNKLLATYEAYKLKQGS